MIAIGVLQQLFGGKEQDIPGSAVYTARPDGRRDDASERGTFLRIAETSRLTAMDVALGRVRAAIAVPDCMGQAAAREFAGGDD
jgi:hypothetical protein